MKFRFKLERMLSFVRIKETMKKLEVSALVQKVTALELRKDRLRTNVNELLEKQKEKLSFGTEWLQFLNQKIELDSKESLKLERMIRKEKEDLENRRYELGVISMRRKGLESLKEKRMFEFKMVERRKAQKRLDQNYQLLKGKTQ
jgi:flagellar biosynthesis chaperone FliJ